jgi:hypothetical protein
MQPPRMRLKAGSKHVTSSEQALIQSLLLRIVSNKEEGGNK